MSLIAPTNINSKSIFLIHTPYQTSFVFDLIVHLKIRNATVFCEGKSVLELATAALSQMGAYAEGISLVEINLIKPQNIGRKSFTLMQENIAKLHKEIASSPHEHTHLYISDINWPTNNYAFFNLSKQIQFFLFEDGIGNYLALKKNKREICRGIIRYALSAVNLAPKFTPYLGEKMGGEQPRIHAQYLRAPKLCNSKATSIETPIRTDKKYNIKIPNNSFIFLDQPYAKLIGVEKYKSNVEAILSEHHSLGYQLYIKQHHFSSSDIISNSLTEKIQTLPNHTPIEEFEIGENTVFCSFNSSALFNLKLIHKNKTKCISILLKESMASTGSSQKTIEILKSKYLEAGVDICERTN